MAEPFEGEILIKGVEEAASKLGKLKDEVKGLGDAAKSSSGSVESVSGGVDRARSSAAAAAPAARNLAAEFVALGEALGAVKEIVDKNLTPTLARLEQQIARTNPALHGLVTNADGSTKSFKELGMALGPLGFALNGIIDITNRITSQFADAETATTHFSAAVAGLNPRSQAYRQTLARLYEQYADNNEATQALTRAHHALAKAFRVAGESGKREAEQIRQLTAALKQQNKLLHLAPEGGGGGGGGGMSRAEREKQAALAAQTAQMDKQEAILERMREERVQMVELERKELELMRQAAEEEERRLQAIKELQDALERKAREEDDRRKRDEMDQQAKRLAVLEDQAKREEELEKQREERRTAGYMAASAALAGSIQMAIEGRKSEIDEYLKGVAISETIEGLKALALIPLFSFTNPAAVAGAAASAGQHFAVAAIAGGGAGIASAAGGGGKGSADKAENVSSGADSGGGGGGDTYVININSPMPEAEIGRMQDRASRAARRRYGGRR